MLVNFLCFAGGAMFGVVMMALFVAAGRADDAALHPV